MVNQKHELTTEKQGEYNYTIGPYNKPVLTINSGDTVVVETQDALRGLVTSEDVKLGEEIDKLRPFLNPLNGPISVNGAKRGDALKIKIESIIPRGKGCAVLLPNFGGLSGNRECPALNPNLPEIARVVKVTTEGVEWNKNITFPYKPFIGVIGTSPLIDSISSATPSNHGGNMDLPYTCPGNILYLPVQVEGAFLYLGDCHATQGDGELCGGGIDFPTYTTITIEVVKGWSLEWPRLENDNFIMSIGSIRPLENAVRIAYDDLIKWMVADFCFDKWDAYLILSQVGRMRLGNIVDPNFTVGTFIEKKYLSYNL